MNKQTAVEWLVDEANLLENNGWILPLINQAKIMEKEQIIDASNGYSTKELLGVTKGEQYYNETYNK